MKNFLVDPLFNLEEFKNLIEDLKSNKDIINVSGIIEEGLGHFIYAIANNISSNKLIISYDANRARSLYEDLKSLGFENVYLFPKRREEFFDTFRRSMDDVYNQIKAIYGTYKKDSIIITDYSAILDKVMAQDRFEKLSIDIDYSSEINLDQLIEKLIGAGYEKVSQVEAKGQFSIRGDIIDIYIPIYDSPFRIELFDIEVDSIRSFNLNSQRSEEEVENIYIVPAREIIILDEEKDEIIENIRKSLYSIDTDNSQVKDNLDNKFGNIIDKLENNIDLNNMSLLTEFMNPNALSSIVDYIGKDTLVIIDEPKRIENNIKEYEEDYGLKFQDLYWAGELLKEHEHVGYNYVDLLNKLDSNKILTFNNVLRDNKYFKAQTMYSFNMKTTTSYNGRMDIFKEEIERYLYKGYKIAILAKGEERLNRIDKSLESLGLKASVEKTLNKEIKSNEIFLYEGSINGGFEYSDIKFAILNHREIYGEKKKARKKKRSKESQIDFANIKVGDYIVHENHGLGIYKGTEQVEIQDVKRDYLVIQYQGADRLYIPTDQLSMLYKYSATEAGKKPKINKLNSVEWKKTKAKAEKSIDDMTDELIDLYGKRESQRGYAFSQDTPWQREFEDAFPYEETQGQIDSIREIKKDMESNKAMDRLLCADVGYGKTEVALRAAFKAVMDNKQVAFLVPTTILAQQHYETMKERFKDFPVNISILSRFRGDSQIKEDLLKLELGELDIVVGTHRLLSKDVKFKDLGLLLVDEEQRFGVRHKETLKMLKENLDTLTLTATPIPRTLQMSMVGIRDMSVIEEPPEERFPVQTYVAEFNINMVKDGIERELDRGGQVYFVYNRVESIDEVAYKIQNLFPKARVKVAHGQMTEKLLEDTFIDFLDHEIDILVCTTIIETGLDVQNANTLIVYNADKFGLSQLYQLRGRVGRSDKIAYAYFTFKDSTSLSEIAERRLIAIRDFTEFGSGYQIALRDLEIRGAGNILGSKQHGHINHLGYDLYLSLLEESVKKKKGESVQNINDTLMDINIGSYIPKSYIKDESQKLEFYKKISKIKSDEDYYDLIEEGIDRYGDLLKPVMNLIEISYIKYLASNKAIESIKGDENGVTISFNLEEDINIDNLKEIINKYGNNIEINPKKLKSFKFKGEDNLLQKLKDLILQL